MVIGCVGYKVETTQKYVNGTRVQITWIKVPPNRITQIKTDEKEGYCAVQVTCGTQSVARLTKAEAGHFANAGVEPGCLLRELEVPQGAQLSALNLGDVLTAQQFELGTKVDVVSRTKGRGMTGVIKRYGFATQDATHGNSLSHRAPGSIGQRQSPGRVFKGKKMAGRTGNERCTMASLEVLDFNPQENLLAIKGSIPGPKGVTVTIKPAVRDSKHKMTENR
jgi:large subunit ribosomal protein L3